MKQAFEEYKELLKIDKNQLDKMVIDQPFLFQAVSEQVAEARANHDQIKFTREGADAAAKQNFRESLTKVTEGLLSEKIALDPSCIDMKVVLVRAKRQLDDWTGLLEAFSQRGSMLKLLVQLQQSELYHIQNNSVTTGAYKEAKETIQQNKQSRRRRAI